MERLKKLRAQLNERIAACEKRQRLLLTDQRSDEASLEKIRANVYGIFRTVSEAAEKQAEPLVFLQKKLEEIPANWQAALEQARTHGAMDAASVEEIKLEAAKEIRMLLEGTL